MNVGDWINRVRRQKYLTHHMVDPDDTPDFTPEDYQKEVENALIGITHHQKRMLDAFASIGFITLEEPKPEGKEIEDLLKDAGITIQIGTEVEVLAVGGEEPYGKRLHELAEVQELATLRRTLLQLTKEHAVEEEKTLLQSLQKSLRVLKNSEFVNLEDFTWGDEVEAEKQTNLTNTPLILLHAMIEELAAKAYEEESVPKTKKLIHNITKNLDALGIPEDVVDRYHMGEKGGKHFPISLNKINEAISTQIGPHITISTERVRRASVWDKTIITDDGMRNTEKHAGRQLEIITTPLSPYETIDFIQEELWMALDLLKTSENIDDIRTITRLNRNIPPNGVHNHMSLNIRGKNPFNLKDLKALSQEAGIPFSEDEQKTKNTQEKYPSEFALCFIEACNRFVQHALPILAPAEESYSRYRKTEPIGPSYIGAFFHKLFGNYGSVMLRGDERLSANPVLVNPEDHPDTGPLRAELRIAATEALRNPEHFMEALMIIYAEAAEIFAERVKARKADKHVEPFNEQKIFNRQFNEDGTIKPEYVLPETKAEAVNQFLTNNYAKKWYGDERREVIIHLDKELDQKIAGEMVPEENQASRSTKQNPGDTPLRSR